MEKHTVSLRYGLNSLGRHMVGIPPVHHQHPLFNWSWASQCLIMNQARPKEFEAAICSIRSVHVLCDAGGGGSMVVGFSVEKERPNKIPNLVQNDTFRETRISCRQRSSASFSFPPTQIHSSDNDPRLKIMHCLNSRSFVLWWGSGRKQDCYICDLWG